EVVAEASNGREALAKIQTHQPDVVVMDVAMPELNGIDATKRILTENPRIKVIGLSMNADRRYVLEMLGAGAVGYMLKSAAADELLHALQVISGGQKYLSPEITGTVVDALAHPTTGGDAPSTGQLSAREREVLQLLAEGRTSKDIAARLHVAVSTIETHRKQIMAKLQLRSVAELTKYAIREGLTPLE
ncbi:MAG TPA: response regulator transcription factor, partial [Polyangiaceae bacterium]|nr:response regulator transcription factor [Polyangiaceae bacterium]